MRKLLFCCVLAFMIGCKGDDLPTGILPAKKMESVMWDLIRADQVLSLPFNSDTTVNHTLKSRKVYQQVLLLHNVSESDFKKSFRYYQKEPSHLKPILDSLRTRTMDTSLPKKPNV